MHRVSHFECFSKIKVTFSVQSTLVLSLEKLKRQVSVHEKALLTLIKQAETIGEQLVRIAKETAPPLLSLRQKEINKIDGEYEVKLVLDPSKNAPFGWLVFNAEIIGKTEASLRKFSLWEMHAWFHPDEPIAISDDTKKATIRYMPQGNLRQRLFLKVSGHCTIRITGNHIEDSIELVIE